MNWYDLVCFGMFWYVFVCICMNGIIGMNWYKWYGWY